MSKGYVELLSASFSSVITKHHNLNSSTALGNSALAAGIFHRKEVPIEAVKEKDSQAGISG